MTFPFPNVQGGHAAAASGVTRQSDLVVWYKMDENTGTAVADSSDSGFDASMQNMDSEDWITGKNGAALAFDGSDDYVMDGGSNYDVATAMNGHLTDHEQQGAFSISYWLLLTDATANAGVLSIGSSSTDGDSWMIIRGDYGVGTVRQRCGYMDGGGYYANTNYWTADSNWHHIVFTFSGGHGTDGSAQWKAYHNGSLDNTYDVGFRRQMTIYGEKLHIGKSWSETAAKSMDDFRIYDIELSLTEVGDIYGRDSGGVLDGSGDW